MGEPKPEHAIRTKPGSITFYDAEGNCIHMKKGYALAPRGGKAHAVSYNGTHLFNVDAKFADGFVSRHSQAAAIMEAEFRSGNLNPYAPLAYRKILSDFVSEIAGNLVPAQPDPTKIGEDGAFHFGSEVAVLRKTGKSHSLQFGPDDTLHVGLSPGRAEGLRSELARLNSEFRRANIALRRALASGKGAELAAADFYRALSGYREFKDRLVVEAMTHEGMAKGGREPQMRLISLH